MAYEITHKNKLREARQMMTRKEIKKHVSPFQSAAWTKRKDRRSDRQLETQDAGDLRRAVRREENLKRHNEMLEEHRRRKEKSE